jgi:hypothetical protein
MSKIQTNEDGKVYTTSLGKVLLGNEGAGPDEYANYIQIENMIKGTSYNESTEVATACTAIEDFIYGTSNS